MKRLIYLLAAVMMMTACAKNNDKKSESANSGEIQGRYELDLTSLVNDEIGDDSDVAQKFANFLLSKMHLIMVFSEDKITLDVSDNLKVLLGTFMDEDDLSATEYKLTNDSLLSTRNPDDEWHEAGVLRRIEGSDDLQWVVDRDEDGSETILLKKKK